MQVIKQIKTCGPRHENIQSKLNQTSNLSLYLPQGSLCERRSYVYFPFPMDSNFCTHQQWITDEKTSIPAGILKFQKPCNTNQNHLKISSKAPHVYLVGQNWGRVSTHSVCGNKSHCDWLCWQPILRNNHLHNKIPCQNYCVPEKSLSTPYTTKQRGKMA